MSDLGRIIAASTEAGQEARHLAEQATPRPVSIRLKRSDPRVQELLRLSAALADTIETGDLTIVRDRLPGAEQAILDALRACGVPVDELLPQIKPGHSPLGASVGVGLGFLKAILPAISPKAGDCIKRVEDALLAKAEKKST